MSTRLDPQPIAVTEPPPSATEQPCGCREGAAAVLAALALLVLRALGIVGLPLIGSGAWAWIGLLFGAALVGKAIGLGVGWARLRRTDPAIGSGRRG